MILVADSGSTKTSWKLIGEQESLTFKTTGINPYYQSAEEIKRFLKEEFKVSVAQVELVEKIYFYGAGISTEQRKNEVLEPLQAIFSKAEIFVDHDLIGAARALLGHNAGIACIAGTGSNTCYYDGEEILQNVPSLGLYLGDEGSGGYKGKLLISDYLRNQLPLDLRTKFEVQYLDRSPYIMEKIYKKPFPNRYLASFMPFIAENQHHEYIAERIIHRSFSELFDKYLVYYPNWKNVAVNFVGSVAFHLKDNLKKTADEKGFELGKILSNPLEELANFHKKTAL